MLNVVEHLRERTGSDKVNLLGYCMGGTLSTMFTAIHQDLVKNLVLLATLNDLVSSTDKEKIIWPAGHIGLAISGRAQKELWPRAVEWLVQRTD